MGTTRIPYYVTIPEQDLFLKWDDLRGEYILHKGSNAMRYFDREEAERLAREYGPGCVVKEEHRFRGRFAGKTTARQPEYRNFW